VRAATAFLSVTLLALAVTGRVVGAAVAADTAAGTRQADVASATSEAILVLRDRGDRGVDILVVSFGSRLSA
jgi:hypothetical protein